MARRRRRRKNPMKKLLSKQTLYGAGGGAVAGLLLTAGAGAARGLPSGGAMPKNAAIGGVLGALASMLAKDATSAAIMGALASGTGIYLFNVASAATAPVEAPEGTAGLSEYVTPGSFLEGLGGLGAMVPAGPLPAVNFDPLMATRMQLGPHGVGEYVTPGAFLEGYVDSSTYGKAWGPQALSEYVTPGAFLEGLGGLGQVTQLLPPQGALPSFRGLPMMASRWVPRF